jgi:ABC-type dipeptide/oligopeptide/nickel transport system permease component
MELTTERNSMFRALFRHGGYAASLFLGALLLAQILFEAVPGDAARRALGPYASQESVSQLREKMGLDRPLAERVGSNMLSALRLDFGKSLSDGRSVGPEVREKFRLTFSLGLQAVVIAACFSLLLLAVVHFFPAASPLLLISRAPSALPSFLSAVLLALAAAIWFPGLISSGSGILAAPLLPSLVAAIYPASILTTTLGSRFAAMRSGPCYRSARAYGHGRWKLFLDALMVPSLSAVSAVVVAQLSLVLFASLVIEIVFSLPGLGTLLLAAIQGNDYPMLQGILIVNAIVFIALHFLSETVNPLLDPRISA